LHKAECVERTLQRGRREQAARHGSAPEVVEGHVAQLTAGLKARRYDK
jgi:hypothetical protein